MGNVCLCIENIRKKEKNIEIIAPVGQRKKLAEKLQNNNNNDSIIYLDEEEINYGIPTQANSKRQNMTTQHSVINSLFGDDDFEYKIKKRKSVVKSKKESVDKNFCDFSTLKNIKQLVN